MIKIGITGPMGSGKSYCAKLFEKIGIPVFYSDDIAKNLLNTNNLLKTEIIKEFGNVYDENGLIIRDKIAKIVFNDKSENLLGKLNKIVHPHVINEYNKFCNNNLKSKYTIIESAILYETKMSELVDDIIYVNTDESTRIERTFKRSGLSENEYHNRMKNQISSDIKLKNSKFIINNNDDDNLLDQIEKINKILNNYLVD